MSLREALADVARFLARPRFMPEPKPLGRVTAKGLLAAELVHLGLLMVVVAPLWLAGRNAGAFPAPRIDGDRLAASPLAFLVIAPLLEELLFRGWLTGRVAALRFAAFGFAAMALMLAGVGLVPDHGRLLGYVGAGVALAGLVHWSLTRARDRSVPPVFIRHFAPIVWASALLFGLIHLGNYHALASPFGLAVVLPQVLGGLLLAYIRTHHGLGAAMAYHAGYNALVLAGFSAGW